MNLVCANDRGSKTIDISDVLYFESLGDDCFCVTPENRYKTKVKLYETEEFGQFGLVRINKSYVVNVFKVITITPQLNSKIKLRMKNNDIVYVNRTYLKAFKHYLMKGDYNND